MRQLFCCTLFLVFLTSCINKEVHITSEYIINPNWNEQANYIQITRMNLKKDSIIDLNNLNQVDVVKRLEPDSSFIYRANVTIDRGESYKDKKILFTKNNNFYWRGKTFNDTTKIIGKLQSGYWYKFSYLVTHAYYV